MTTPQKRRNQSKNKKFYATLSPLTSPGKWLSTAHNTNHRRQRYSVLGSDSVIQQPSGLDPQLKMKQLETHKQLSSALDLELPAVKRERMKGLEQWLNDVLEHQGAAGRSKEPLINIKKFGFDKQTLKNSNLSMQQIDSLYSGLFIYTNGVKSAFKELLEMSAIGQDHKLARAYWQVFIRLLELAIPVKTCFQITEEHYLRQITEHKHNARQMTRMHEQNVKQLEHRVHQLTKELQMVNYRYTQMEKDYQIISSSLDVTERAFEDEVHLRLKFEEKINQVYVVYEELKEKHELMREELRDKVEEVEGFAMYKVAMENKLIQSQITIKQLEQKLQWSQGKVQVLKKDLKDTNQQVQDLKIGINQKNEFEEASEAQINQLRMTIKRLQRQMTDMAGRQKTAKQSLAQNDQQLAKTKETMAYVREKNDELYLKFHEATLKYVPVEHQNLKLSIELKETQKKSQLADIKVKELEGNLEVCNSRIEAMQYDIKTKDKTITEINKAMESIKTKNESMRHAKDRSQRITQKYKKQLEAERLIMEDKVKALAQMNQSNTELNFDLEKARSMVEMWQGKFFTLQKIVQKKSNEINEVHKQYQVELRHKENEIEQKRTEVQLWIDSANQLQTKVESFDNEQLNKLQEITFLTEKSKAFERDANELKGKLSNIQAQNTKRAEEITQLKKTIQNKEYALSQRKDKTNHEVVNLKTALAQDREQFSVLKGYIHPMVYEDAAEQVRRLYDKIEGMKEWYSDIDQKYEKMQNELEQAQKENEKKTLQIEDLNTSLEKRRALSKGDTEQFKEKLDKLAAQKQTMKKKYQSDISNRMEKFKKYEAELLGAIEMKEDQLEYQRKLTKGLEDKLDKREQEIYRHNKSKNEKEDRSVQTDRNFKKLDQIRQDESEVFVFTPEADQDDEQGEEKRYSSQLPKRSSRHNIRKSITLVQGVINETHHAQFTNFPSHESQGTKQGSNMRQSQPQRKLQQRDFKKALKLTYMRR